MTQASPPLSLGPSVTVMADGRDLLICDDLRPVMRLSDPSALVRRLLGRLAAGGAAAEELCADARIEDTARIYYLLDRLRSLGLLVEGAVFGSPLRGDLATRFQRIDFGPVAEAPAVAALHRQINGIPWALADHLPPRLAGEVRGMLDAHSLGSGDFLQLFRVPMWSFLHWGGAEADHAVATAATTVQACGLFLHLWDDHLRDGRMRTDTLRLHLRGLAWCRFATAADAALRRLGLPDDMLREHEGLYLEAVHQPAPVATLADYCERFRRRVALWTLAPRLLQAATGHDGLVEAVEQFAIAWRLVDDVQDVAADAAGGRETAVWLMLDEPGRALWSACRTADGRPQPSSDWAALESGLLGGPAVARVLAAADAAVGRAQAAALRAGAPGLATELAQSRQGLSRPDLLPAVG